MKEANYYFNEGLELYNKMIVKDIEAKYQADHERVGKWLEENDMF